MQTGMQISPDLLRKFVKPAWHSVLSTVKKYYPEAYFFLHCCGNIEPIVNDIVETGFHILHPVQHECMNLSELFQKFGDSIVLCGTVSAQRSFPFGTIEDIQKEVMNIMDMAGESKRILICPSNIIQPETPWKNILCFHKTARTYGGGKNCKGTNK
jgi:uroporphyrinogen decarboxylase